MELKLIKQGDFLGTKCDFYVDELENIYMSRTQIGYALEYANPSKAIEKLHNRNSERMNSLSLKVRGSQIGGGSKHFDKDTEMWLYNERGVFALCGYSKQPIADKFNDWVYDVIINIRKNGYYIATEKDEKWLGIRQKSKLERRNFTDEIQEFVEYAKQHGSSKPEMYYKHFTKLVNDKLGISKDTKRDDLTQSQLMDIMALERVITMKLPKLITDDMDYHDVYKQIKKLISII